MGATAKDTGDKNETEWETNVVREGERRLGRVGRRLGERGESGRYTWERCQSGKRVGWFFDWLPAAKVD